MSRYSVPDHEIRITGVRFTVAELYAMAEAQWRGVTPPPLSYNEAALLATMRRLLFEQALDAAADGEAERLSHSLGLPPGYEVRPSVPCMCDPDVWGPDGLEAGDGHNPDCWNHRP